MGIVSCAMNLDIDPSSAPREKNDNGSFGGRGFSKGMWDYIIGYLRKTKVIPSCQQFGDFQIFEAILLVECQTSDPKDLHLKIHLCVFSNFICIISLTKLNIRYEYSAISNVVTKLR